MSNSIIEQQLHLMGITENLFTSQQTPVTIIKKIEDMRIHADNVAHHTEMANRAFRNISKKLKDFESKSLHSSDVLSGAAKSLMSEIRTSMAQIDSAQARANDLLRSVDFLISNSSQWAIGNNQ